MKKDSLLISIITVLAVGISFFSFTMALAYLQIPKEIPTPEEIEIALESKKLEEKEMEKVVKKPKIPKPEEEKKPELTKKILPYYSSLVDKRAWKGTGTAKITIILDDAGYSVNGCAKKLLGIQAPLTFSILPGLKYSQQIANQCYEKGKEVMLHMPMENCGNSRMTKEDKLCEAGHNMKPYKYAVLIGMSQEEIAKNLEGAINDIPHVVGINNHMGSKATADEVTMTSVLDQVKIRNLYFIDSVTTGRSVAYKLAKRKGIPTNERTVFLDNINDTEYVKERINELIYRAKQKGYAIGIGHATKEATAEALVEMVPKLKEYGIEVVPASCLVN
ncbi:MAG: divergent polysaccharide deacetylase family protein [bacterium]